MCWKKLCEMCASLFGHAFKGVIGCKIHFTSCLNKKCVLEVCVHIQPIMIKIHPVFFLNPHFKIPFLKSGCSEVPVRMTYFCTDRSHDSWLTRPSYLRPALSELSWVCHCVDPSVGEDKMSQIKWLKCLVVGCNNKHSRKRGEAGSRKRGAESAELTRI